MKHNLANDRPSRELLARLIDEKGLLNVLSTRSPAYKARNLGARELSKDEAIDLLLEDPNLMRRPLVLGSAGKAVLGFVPEEYDSLR